MPYVCDSFWRGRELASLAQMQQAALQWCLSVAGRHFLTPLNTTAYSAPKRRL